MRTSNYIVGIAFSVVLHGLMLVRCTGNGPASPPALAVPRAPIQIASITPSEDMPPPQARRESTPSVTAPPAPEPVESLPLDNLSEPFVDEADELDPPDPIESEPSDDPSDFETSNVFTPSVHSTVAAEPESESAPESEAEPAALPEPSSSLAGSLVPEPQPDPAPVGESTPGEPVAPAMEASEPRPAQRRSVPTPGRRAWRSDAEHVPPLRIHWNDGEELREVARALGMRLAAVNRQQDIIAEIDLSDAHNMKAWRGLPPGYSNRVRTLPPTIFNPRLRAHGNVIVREVWVFVPTDRDRSMIEAQRSAIEQAGFDSLNVAYVDGRFVRSANGSYRLVITNIQARGGR